MNPLKAAHDHSFNTRQAVETGGRCGCYCCLKTFNASQIKKWLDNTAVCPYCHIDSVLSKNVDPIDPVFLNRMQDAWFNKKSLNIEFRRPIQH